MYLNKEMSLEQNKQEEGPGAFLSLSAQASSPPFRGPPAVEVSSRVLVKQEEGDLETCLSLQQPTQQQSVEPLHEQQAFVHAQESFRSHNLDQSEAHYIENPLCKQKVVDSSEQTGLSLSEELSERQKHLGAGETQKSSSLEYEQPSSLPMSTCTTVQGPPDEPATTWLALVEQPRVPTCLGLLQQQEPLEHPKETSFGSTAQQSHSSFHGISEEQKQGLSLPVSPLSLQVSPIQEKRVDSAQEEKLAFSKELEKMQPLQPSSEQNSLLFNRPGTFSLQAEQGRDAPVLAQDQKALFSSKEHPDQHNSTHLHMYPDQQKLPLSQQWHKSAFMQAHTMPGPLDPPKEASWQEPYSEQKFNFIPGNSGQQKAVSERKADSQVISHGQLLHSHQGFLLQPPSPATQDRAGVALSMPTIALAPAALSRDKELSLSAESPRPCLASPYGAGHVYPTPLATHEAVLADRRLFMETLQSFHAALNSQVSLLKVEGMDLDLYKLYKEVTCRGGLEAVMKSGEWQDVVRAFNFPSNALNASFVLRKTYIHTLGHYEKVYFLGASGTSTPHAPYTSQSSALSKQVDGRGSCDLEVGLHIMNGSSKSAEAHRVDPALSVGAIVSGAIDGKFEDGYLVTVMVGGRRMRGVLYHVASTDMLPQNASVPSMMQIVSSEIQAADVAPKIGRKRKKREVFRKDPNAPRQNRTGYNFFFAEQRAKLKTMQPDKDRAISKMIGELWSKLSEDEKSPYQVKGVKDKERYVREMKEYKEKIKVPLIGGAHEVHTSSPLPSQLPYTYISQPLNEPRAVPPRLGLLHVPQEFSNHKGLLSQHPMAIMSEAVSDPKAMQMECSSTFMSEAQNVSQTALLPMGDTLMRTSEQHIVDTTSSHTTAGSGAILANTTNTTTMIHTPTSYSVSNSLVTRTAVDMSKFLVDETSPKSLPQSSSQAGSDALTDAEEHVSTMEH